jgi:hypothetical protein
MNKKLPHLMKPLKLYAFFVKNPQLFNNLTKINQFASIHSTNNYLSEAVSRRTVITEDLVLLQPNFLGVFAKLRIAAISFVMYVIKHVCLSVRLHGTTHVYGSRLCNLN